MSNIRVIVLALICSLFFSSAFAKTNTSTAVSSSANPSTYGSSVTFTATVTPSAATGTVTFKDGTTTLGTGTLSSGRATYSTSTLAAGSHSITAVYGGNTTYNGSTSSLLTQTVNKANSTIAMSSSANPSTYGSSVKFTGTVTPSTCGGTVTFKDGSSTLGTGTLSSGKATYTTTALTAGSHSITGSYAGDSNCNSSNSSALSQTVNKANTTTAVSSSANPSGLGVSVTFTATMTPSGATGTVIFKDGTATLGTATVSNGSARFSTSTLTLGSHSMTAAYGGDSNYNTSTSSRLTQTVKRGSVAALLSSTNPAPFSSPVTLTALVSPSAATGVVTFLDGSTSLGTGTLSAGSATLSTSSLAIGVHSITAVYGGDANYIGSTSAVVTQSVLTLSSISVSPPTVSVALGATQQFTATGTFSDGTLGNVTASATWTSSSTAVATISNVGIVTILDEGVTTIQAAVGSINSSATLTGTPSRFRFTGNLLHARDTFTATVLQSGKVLIAGGTGSGASLVPMCELYDPATGTFSNTGNLLVPRFNHTATLLNNGMVLIAGGEVSNGDTFTWTASAELYDPATGGFSWSGNLSQARQNHTATLLGNGLVLIAGGSGPTSWPATAELYDPNTNSFSNTGDLIASRYGHTATLLNDGTVLLAGGQALNNGVASIAASAEIYDPSTGIFTATGSLNVASTGHSATLLNNGMVLIAVGIAQSNSSELARTELYDPSARSFTLSGSLTTGRQLFATALLSNGQVLFTGGVGSNQFIRTGELYDPATGTTSIAGNLNVPRGYHAAAALNNGLVLIAAGIGGQNMLHLTSAETYQATAAGPPPASLTVTPAVANLIVGGSQRFTAVDNLGYPRLDVTWTVSDPSLASVTTGEDGISVLTALGPGQVTLTATAEAVTAQAQITILSETSFPAGTSIWSAPPPPGFAVQQLAQAVPSVGGPDLYSVSASSDGTQSVIQALSADGQQLWQKTVPQMLNNAVPDGFGGLITTTCESGKPLTVTNLDANGQPLWQQESALVKGYGYLCYPPQIAVGGDGTAYITEPTNAGLPSLTVVPPSGYASVYQFQTSTVTNYGNTINVNCCVGPPMVNTDGTMYVEYEVRNTNNNVITSDTLYLYNEASRSSTALSTTIQDEALLPGPIIPDGQGGLLVTWTVSPSHSVRQYPYQAADVTNGSVGASYGLPFSPQTVAPFQSPDLVLGENGTALASGPTTVTNNGVQIPVDQIVSFNVTSGMPNWTYQAAAGDKLSIIEATAGGGVTVNNSNTGVFSLNSSGVSNSSSRASRLARIANASTVSSLPSGAVPFDLSTWVSAGTGTASSFWSPDGTNGITTLLAQSVYPQHHGDSQGHSQPPYCHRINIICALAPTSETITPNGPAVQRNVKYQLFSLQGAYLIPKGNSPETQQSKIALQEYNSTSSSAGICDWKTPAGKCYSPDPNNPDNRDPGFLTDHDTSGGGPAYSVDMRFAVDRAQVQVFWPLRVGNDNYETWYGAWYQTANDSANAVTIVQHQPDFSKPMSCPTGCSSIQPNGKP